MKQKRARSQLSCTACRQGKLKCSRATPCDQCVKRSKESECIYLPPPPKSRSGQNVKGRIQHLEQLVVDLMNSRSADNDATSSSGRTNRTATSATKSPSLQTQASTVSIQEQFRQDKLPPEVSPPYSEDGNSPVRHHQYEASEPGSLGHLRISKEETSYVGSSHWANILDSISELKRDLEDSGNEASDEEFDAWQIEEPLNTCESGLPGLLRSPRRVTKAELLSLLPPKSEVDGLISMWFNAPNPWKSLTHAPTFQNEYHQFWRAPEKAPVMWLGLLYAMLGIASSFKCRTWKGPSTAELQAASKQADLYQELAASAAVLGNYMKPKAYTIECLIINASSSMTDNIFDAWILLGVVVRLALRMGYHRDPSHYKNVSVLSGEMRRRVWHLLCIGDTLLSFQLGLPAMLRTVQSDTQPPHNLFDQDFSIHSKTLPPSRPIEEITPSSYAAAKVQMCQVFAQAADLSHATIAPSYKQVMDLDAQAEEVQASIPSALRFESLGLYVTDNPEFLMCRYNLELLFLKTKTVLHRRFMVPTGGQQVEPYSRECCIGSAMNTLRHHQDIYRASQPGGQLESVSWYMCSIGTHDFLLASMIICLELARQLNQPPGSVIGEIATRKDMIAALEASKRVWEKTSAEVDNIREPSFNGRSHAENASLGEIKKACKAMAAMLEKVQGDSFQNTCSVPASTQIYGTGSSWPDMSTLATTMPVQLPTTNDWQGPDQWPSQNDLSMLDDMMDVSNDINWVSPDKPTARNQPTNSATGNMGPTTIHTTARSTATARPVCMDRRRRVIIRPIWMGCYGHDNGIWARWFMTAWRGPLDKQVRRIG